MDPANSPLYFLAVPFLIFGGYQASVAFGMIVDAPENSPPPVGRHFLLSFLSIVLCFVTLYSVTEYLKQGTRGSGKSSVSTSTKVDPGLSP